MGWDHFACRIRCRSEELLFHAASPCWQARAAAGIPPAKLLLSCSPPPQGFGTEVELYVPRHTRPSLVQTSPEMKMVQKGAAGAFLHKRLGLCARFCPKKICDYFISRLALKHTLYYNSAQYCDPQLVHSGDNNILRQ